MTIKMDLLTVEEFMSMTVGQIVERFAGHLRTALDGQINSGWQDLEVDGKFFVCNIKLDIMARPEGYAKGGEGM